MEIGKKNPTHNNEKQPHRNKSTHEYIRCESWNLKCLWMFVYITRWVDIYYFLSTFPSNQACGCIFKWPLLLTSNLVQAGLYLSSGIRAKYNRGYLKRASCCYVEMQPFKNLGNKVEEFQKKYLGSLKSNPRQAPTKMQESQRRWLSYHLPTLKNTGCKGTNTHYTAHPSIPTCSRSLHTKKIHQHDKATGKVLPPQQHHLPFSASPAQFQCSLLRVSSALAGCISPLGAFLATS